MGASKWKGVTVAEAVTLDHIEKQVTVGISVAVALKPDPMRVGFLAQSSGTGNITLSLSDKVAAGAGIYLAAGARPVFISDEDMPALAAQGFYAIGDAAGCTLELISVRLLGN